MSHRFAHRTRRSLRSASSGLRGTLGAAVVLALALASGTRGGDGGPEPLTLELFLDDVQGEPGGTVEVPLRVRTSRGLSLLLASIEFDPTVLQLVEPPTLSRPLQNLRDRLEEEGDGESFSFEWQADNEAGTAQLLLVVDFEGRERNSIPPGLLSHVASLSFEISTDSDGSPTEVRFAVEGSIDTAYEGPSGPVYNEGRAHGAPFGPESLFDASEPATRTDGGTVLPIVGDVGFFLRGDANLDEDLDLSDSIRILRTLFSGGDSLPCFESADFTRDGDVDVSDPIAILTHLFTGPSEGADPDGMRREEPELVYCPLD